MHPVEGHLGVHKFECLVVTIKNELIHDQIVFPMLQGSNNGVEFLLIGVPLLSCFAKLLAKKFNRPHVLGHYCSNTIHRGIRLHLKNLIKVRQCEHIG